MVARRSIIDGRARRWLLWRLLSEQSGWIRTQVVAVADTPFLTRVRQEKKQSFYLHIYSGDVWFSIRVCISRNTRFCIFCIRYDRIENRSRCLLGDISNSSGLLRNLINSVMKCYTVSRGRVHVSRLIFFSAHFFLPHPTSILIFLLQYMWI